MRALGSLLAGVAVFVCLPGDVRPQAESVQREQEFQERIRPFFKRYCVGCHNSRMKTAGVVLDGFVSSNSVDEDGATWERIVRKLRTGEMPPPGMPRPPIAIAAGVVQWGEQQLDRAALEHPNPGRVTVHRLNRAEYNNAVRDLLAVDFHPGNDFPADDAGYGFDNIGDVLSISPVLVEKYLAAALKVSRTALGHIHFEPVLERFSAPRSSASRHGFDLDHPFPADAEYLLRIRVRGMPRPGEHERVELQVDDKELSQRDIWFTDEEQEDKRRIEAKVQLTGGKHHLRVSIHRDDGPAVAAVPGHKPQPPLAVDWIEIGGPFDAKRPGNTESRKLILKCNPGQGKTEEGCATEILGHLARRAWRRPVTSAETARLMRFYRQGRKDSGEFEGGIELGLKAILVSPNFLFRVETGTGALSDLALASRLSFFLWSSIPDEELLRLAERNELSRPGVVQAQVRRMLADPKSSALTSNFAGQWLHLRNLASVKPDPEKFPEFDSDLRADMQREAELFFDSVVQENRSVLDFVDARYTFVNARLAKFYGLTGVEGSEFRRVELTDGRRGGVLTMGAMLAVTSYPTRTSPVIRGKWVLENLLGGPPPPPPPDVPPLSERGLGKIVSMRQQLEQHRANPACAGCHAKMDPIGFALENYDPIGRFRTKDGGFDIDSAGKLPSGEEFKNAAELKATLRANPREFILCFTEKLLTYATGRGIEWTDKPVVRAIAREAAKDDYRFASMVEAVSESSPFRMRGASEVTTKRAEEKTKETNRAGD